MDVRYTLGYCDKNGEFWGDLFTDTDLEAVKEMHARLNIHQYDRPNQLQIRKATTTYEIVE